MLRYLLIISSAAFISACASDNAQLIGMPNPASVHCEKKGGTSTIVKDADGGEYGMCHLPDGRVIEEWALYREDSGQ